MVDESEINYPTPTKKCTGECGQEKPMTEEYFYFRKDWQIYDYWCRTCKAKNQKEQYEKRKEERKQYGRNRYTNNKEEINAKNREYQKRPEVQAKIKKQYNKEEKAEYNAKYYAENKKEINRKRAEKSRIDPIKKLRSNVSQSIRAALRSNNSSKEGRSIIKYLAYTIISLKLHLESKFEWWMTWENYGAYRRKPWKDNNPSTWTWSIDHIIPQSDLPYLSMEDENFKKCWALENLRPLSAKQNVLDGATMVRHNCKSMEIKNV